MQCAWFAVLTLFPMTPFAQEAADVGPAAPDLRALSQDAREAARYLASLGYLVNDRNSWYRPIHELNSQLYLAKLLRDLEHGDAVRYRESLAECQAIGNLQESLAIAARGMAPAWDAPNLSRIGR